MKKLVKLDSNLKLTHVDEKAVRKAALDLKNYIEKVSEDEFQKFEYNIRIVPIIEQILRGDLQMPYHGPDAYSYRLIMEGHYPELPGEFEELYLKMKRMMGGAVSEFSMSTHLHGKFIIGEYAEFIDGDRYEWCWFED